MGIWSILFNAENRILSRGSPELRSGKCWRRIMEEGPMHGRGCTPGRETFSRMRDSTASSPRRLPSKLVTATAGYRATDGPIHVTF